MHMFKWFWKWFTWVFLSPSLGTNTPTLPKRMTTPFSAHMLWLLLANCPPPDSMTQASSLGISCRKGCWRMLPHINPYESVGEQRTLELFVTLNCHSNSKHIKLNKRCNSHAVFLPYHFVTSYQHLKSWGWLYRWKPCTVACCWYLNPTVSGFPSVAWSSSRGQYRRNRPVLVSRAPLFWWFASSTGWPPKDNSTSHFPEHMITASFEKQLSFH